MSIQWLITSSLTISILICPGLCISTMNQHAPTFHCKCDISCSFMLKYTRLQLYKKYKSEMCVSMTCLLKIVRYISFDINFGSTKVIQWVPRRHKVLTHGQERLFRKVTSVSIHSFVEWLDTFSYVLRPADVTVKEVNHLRCFAIDIAKDLILLSCRLTMEHLCVLQLETALATLVTASYKHYIRRA
jgi:hypothetical protein